MALIDKIGSIDLTPLLVYLVDNTEQSALIHLADQFHILGNEGWNMVTTDYEKRNLIKNAIKNHKYKGTKKSVITALESLGFNVELKEWFVKKGIPLPKDQAVIDGLDLTPLTDFQANQPK